MPVLLATYQNKTAGFILHENKKQITIGRDMSNDMPLPMTLVSRVHASISHHGDSWYVRDLNSSHGVKVNEQRIKGKVKIQQGDQIRLGQVRLKFIGSDKIPQGIKRLKDKRDFKKTKRITFQCKYCSNKIKVRATDTGRRVQCEQCSQIVHVPGQRLKRKVRPEKPIGLLHEEELAQTLIISQEQREKYNRQSQKSGSDIVTIDDLHDELAAVVPVTSENKDIAKDQACAMRDLRKEEMKRELMRDNRSLIEKVWSQILIQFALNYSRLKDPGFPIHRWHVALPALVLICFMMVGALTNGGANKIEVAPATFVMTCGGCSHDSEMALERFEKLSFFMMHPDSFHQKYPGEKPPEPSVCSSCGKRHQQFQLRVDPADGQRKLLATVSQKNKVQVANVFKDD